MLSLLWSRAIDMNPQRVRFHTTAERLATTEPPEREGQNQLLGVFCTTAPTLHVLDRTV